MKCLTNGIALYDLKYLNIKDALSIAEYFFERVNIVPNSIYYFYLHSPNKKGETVSTLDISINELKTLVNQEKISNFKMYYSSTDRLWDIGFTFVDKNSNLEEKISHITIQCLDDLVNIKEFREILSYISKKTNITYGIGYQLQSNVNKCFNYVFSFDLSTIYEYENVSEWLYQLPSRSNEEPLYIHKLRMVYPLNILNEYHIDLKIDELNIQNWIKSDPKNGKLEKINQNYLWTVNPSELERINQIFGENDLLISYQPNVNIPKPKRKLP